MNRRHVRSPSPCDRRACGVGVAVVLALASSSASLTAQCVVDWLPGPGVRGVNGSVQAILPWDPDGPGPLPEVALVCGYFDHVGAMPVNGVATYDPVSGEWQEVGGGVLSTFLSQVRCAAIGPSAELVVGGQFHQAGSSPATNVARWDGSGWAPLGAGVDGFVTAVAVAGNGDVYVGLEFSGTAGGLPVDGVARWDGSAWHALGAGIPGRVEALAVLPNGDVVAGGSFTSAGGVVADNIARWDGASWWPMAGGVYGMVLDLLVLANGALAVGGSFTQCDGVPSQGLAFWDGIAWTPCHDPLSSGISGAGALAISANGNVLIAGGHIAEWSGSSWIPIATTSYGSTGVMSLPGGDVLVGSLGPYQYGDSQGVRWDGSAWQPVVDGFSGSLICVEPMPNGDVVVAGRFLSIDGVPAVNIARRSGGTWSSLGNVQCRPDKVMVAANGDVVVAGVFNNAYRVQRWDGLQWTQLGGIFSGWAPYPFDALTEMANGDLVVCGKLNAPGGAATGLARWDGVSWSSIGGNPDWLVDAMDVTDAGDLIVLGSFTSIGGVPLDGAARWDGQSWWPLGSGFGGNSRGIWALDDGELLAAGYRNGNSGLYRWDGATWNMLGSDAIGIIFDVEQLPDGDLVVGGAFASIGALVTNGIARWDGSAWSTWGSGTQNQHHTGGDVRGMAWLGDRLAIGGGFESVGGVYGSAFLELTTTCPATTTVVGAGCAGSGGANVLVATSQPWLGSTYRATATGMPALGVAVDVYGLASLSVPLSLALPAAVGCDLVAVPDQLGLLLPQGGAVQSTLAVPGSAALAGAQLWHQVVAFELAAVGGVIDVTASNALRLELGIL